MEGLLLKYFVLKPAGNDKYAEASRAGMRAFAKVIAEEDEGFANSVASWANREFANTDKADKAFSGD